MNQDVLKGKWTQMKGAIQNQWSLLTDDDMKRISGKYDLLVGKLQDRYGYSEEEALKKIKAFSNHISKTMNESNLKHIGISINKQARKSPWTLAALTSIGGILIGMMLKNRMPRSKLRLRMRR